jgi:hypothetical protein
MSLISLTTKDIGHLLDFFLFCTYENCRVQKVSSSFPFNQNGMGFEVDHSQLQTSMRGLFLFISIISILLPPSVPFLSS